jgi:hypothetical protein
MKLPRMIFRLTHTALASVTKLAMRIPASGCTLAVAALTTLLTLPGRADTVTNVSLNNYYNGNWSTEINGSQIAAAPTDGNTHTGLTFADYNGQSFLLGPGGVQTIAIGGVSLNNDPVVNALLNNYYGAATTEAVVTFTNSLDETSQYSLIGGQTIRDYNNDGYQNTLQGYNSTPGLGDVTAQEWWNNGSYGQRLDAQTFVLPSSWNGTKLTSVQINDPGSSGGDDVLSALQVDDVSPSPSTVPEPSTLLMLGTGSVALAGALRRRVLKGGPM